MGDVEKANELIREAYELLPFTVRHPVGCVQWIHVDRVQANDYNPNSVAHQEMRLLHTSIKEDGYTQPVVAIIEPSVGIVLPCQHFSPLDPSLAPFLMTLCWGTPQASLTAREASLPLSDSPTGTRAGESRSASPKGTTGRRSANGSEAPGASVTSTSSGDSASPTSGTSRASAMSPISWEHVCPTCASSDSARKKSWQSSRLSPADWPEDAGLTLIWLSSPPTPSDPLPILPGRSTEVSSPSAGSAVVCDTSKAIIVDGYHRYTVMKRFPDIAATTGDYLPVVVIDKDIADRIASTVRHNRARGKHSVAGMGNLVFQMLEEGEDDATICDKLGLEPQELVRLKHITGYSKLYADKHFGPLVLSESQMKEKAKYKREHPEEEVPAV